MLESEFQTTRSSVPVTVRALGIACQVGERSFDTSV